MTIDDLLTACVVRAVGAEHATPREGQMTLARDIWASMNDRGFAVAKAPTGTGKSLAALSAAALAAAKRGERTAISTHALTLQDQYADTDAPPVLEVVLDTLGIELRTATLKGVGNYPSITRISGLLQAARIPGSAMTHSDVQLALLRLPDASDDALVSAAVSTSGLWRMTDRLARPSGAAIREALEWGLTVHLDDNDPADKKSSPVGGEALLWSLIAGGSSMKPRGTTVESKVDIARAEVADANIVFVNHALLGMRAATGRPIVIDADASVGSFDHLIVDEAHLLPETVRSQGTSKLSPAMIRRVQSAARDIGGGLGQVAVEGDHVAHLLDVGLRRWLGMEFGPDDNPVGDAELAIKQWCNQIAQTGKSAIKGAPILQRERLVEAVTELDTVLDLVQSHHPTREARWVELDHRQEPHISIAPIEVGGLLVNNAWRRPPQDGRPQDAPFRDKENPDAKVPLGVTAMSATLGVSARIELGLPKAATEHPTPFAANYASSILHVPQLDAATWATLVDDPHARKPRFDVQKHAVWSRGHAERFARANDGRALMLCTTNKNAQDLTEHLRATLGDDIPVYSQWDKRGLEATKSLWKQDERAILVGSKSLMTGVDAPGETCSLVWLDRVPRVPSNRIDDGRMKAMVARNEKEFVARETIYAGDAAQTMEQVQGRLIRAAGDWGVFALAEPRLAPGALVTYNSVASGLYWKPLRTFGQTVYDVQQALDWTAQRRAGVSPAAQ